MYRKMLRKEKSHRYTGTHTHVLDSTAGRTLTLVTCFPFHFVGHAPKRYIVSAQFESTQQIHFSEDGSDEDGISTGKNALNTEMKR